MTGNNPSSSSSLPQQMQPPALRRGLRWVLVGSLALNLAVVGIVVGAALSGRGGGPHRGIEVALGPFIQALGADDRRAIMRDLRQDGRLKLPSRADRARDLAELVTTLRVDPFDPVRLSEALNRQRDRALAAQATTQEVLVARIAAMTAAQRSALADRLAVEAQAGPGGG